MPITKRCIRCRQILRGDNTCQNPKCVRYVPKEDNNKNNNLKENEEKDS